MKCSLFPLSLNFSSYKKSWFKYLTCALLITLSFFSCSDSVEDPEIVLYQNTVKSALDQPEHLAKSIEIERREINLEEGQFVESYFHNGEVYHLIFNEDHNGEPVNTETASRLREKLRDKKLYKVRRASNMRVSYLFDNRDDAEEYCNNGIDYIRITRSNGLKAKKNNNLRSSFDCWFFHKDCSYSGETMVAQQNASIHLFGGQGNCTELWAHHRLKEVQGQSFDGNWNDQISSWTGFRSMCLDGAPLGQGTVKIALHRHSNFSTDPCDSEAFLIDIEDFSSVSCLTEAAWCFWWWQDMNDEISSWQLVRCLPDCSECFDLFGI